MLVIQTGWMDSPFVKSLHGLNECQSQNFDYFHSGKKSVQEMSANGNWFGKRCQRFYHGQFVMKQPYDPRKQKKSMWGSKGWGLSPLPNPLHSRCHRERWKKVIIEMVSWFIRFDFLICFFVHLFALPSIPVVFVLLYNIVSSLICHFNSVYLCCLFSFLIVTFVTITLDYDDTCLWIWNATKTLFYHEIIPKQRTVCLVANQYSHIKW